ncbi:hypothetical protein F66182_801 [Fusarium sp. NRRL 66182]|nr:hypothetical protein F66182_801 [Fusarium sp. NRRL 66182]
MSAAGDASMGYNWSEAEDWALTSHLNSQIMTDEQAIEAFQRAHGNLRTIGNIQARINYLRGNPGWNPGSSTANF